MERVEDADVAIVQASSPFEKSQGSMEPFMQQGTLAFEAPTLLHPNVKTAELASIARASVTTATAVKPGLLPNTRSRCLRSQMMSPTRMSPRASRASSRIRPARPNYRRAARGLLGRHAGREVAPHLFLDVEAKFLVHLAVEPER